MSSFIDQGFADVFGIRKILYNLNNYGYCTLPGHFVVESDAICLTYSLCMHTMYEEIILYSSSGLYATDYVKHWDAAQLILFGLIAMLRQKV